MVVNGEVVKTISPIELNRITRIFCSKIIVAI